MASTIEEAKQLCRNLEFESKLKIVMAFLADEILQEAATVPFHITRVRWANRALNRPAEEVRKVCLIMSLVPGVDDTLGDAQLINETRLKINSFAGAFNEVAELADGDIERVEITETDHDSNPATAPVVTKRSIFSRLRGRK